MRRLAVRYVVRRWHIYTLVGLLGASIVVVSFIVMQAVIREIVLRERQSVHFYAEMLRIFADPMRETDPFLFVLLDYIVPTIAFPVAVTDPQGEPLYPYVQNTLNLGLDSTWSAEEQRQYVRRWIQKMAREFPPVPVVDARGVELARIYYSTSELVRWIRWIPYVQALLVAALLLVGWWSLGLLRQAEESRLWVAMAKEAAHQLGTPLSSLLGWLELLRQRSAGLELQEILHELGRDIERLQSVAIRFSQIGAQPQLAPEPVAPLIEEVVAYLQRRLPRSKRILIEQELDPAVVAVLNRELFAWAVENLLKNAVEAIERPPGRIRLRLTAAGAVARLEICDNGRGIPSGMQRRIFEPGFTTKRRGWGLGLTLAQRIVEQYHGGRLYLKESIPGSRTVFILEVPLAENPRRTLREGSLP